MAIRYAVASGVWSNTATWNGGTLPTSADDVFTNTFTVNIDQDITGSSLRNTINASPAITAGGSFVVSGNSGTRNITLTGVSSNIAGVNTGLLGSTGLGVLLNITATSGATVNINTNLIGGGGGVALNNPNVVINGNATVNVAGRVGPPTQFTNCILSQSAGASINIVGDMYGGSSSNALSISQAATVNVTGTLAGNTTTATGLAVNIAAVSTVTVTGNLIGGAGTAAQAMLSNSAGSTINITGNLTAGTGEALGDNNTICAYNITGNVTASSTRPAIVCLNTTLVTINGNLINNNSVVAALSPKIRISPTASQTWTFQTAGPNRQMFTANAFSGGTTPLASDVRYGVSYAGGALSGTCYVPSPDSVVYGVPVDATTGTSIINRAQLLTDIGNLMAGYPQI